jgi:hypothetical protein
MNFKARLCCLFLMAVAVIAGATSSTSAQTRIIFARGATRATARGYLRGVRDEVFFVLRAQANQHMRVEISGRGATRGVVIFPSGKQDGGPGGVVFDDKIDETGDYRIRVTESSMANAWRGNFTVTIDVVSEGSNEPANDNQRLARYVGKYPSDLFRGVPSLKARLRTLLGTRYQFFFNRIQTEMPIENDGGVLIVQGCMAHQCTIEVAILAIDLANGNLHVAIKSTEFRNMYKLWSEPAESVPAALRRAMQQASP